MRLIPFLPICALGLCGLCVAGLPAMAGTLIVNGSLGRDCYMATMLEPTPENNRRAVTACDLAVASTADDVYDHMAAYVNRADVRLRMQDFQAAVADSEQAIALVPGEGVAYLNRGAGMVGLKQYQDAVEALTHAIALDVRPAQAAYFNRALAKESLGDIQGAYQDYKQALTLDPKFQPAAEELKRFKVVSRGPDTR